MALYMMFHAIPDSHIDFLCEHPATFRPYMDGTRPELGKSILDKLFARDVSLDLPSDWPRRELEGACPEVNHRQVQYFHCLMNGTEDKVDHAGCIFQTWFAPRSKTVAVQIDGENFALKSQEVTRLKELIKTVTEPELLTRYRDAVGEPDVSDADREFLAHAFGEIQSACDRAIEAGHGLMWTSG